MKIYGFLTGLCLLATLAVEAQTYVFFDGNCGDRIRFDHTDAQQNRSDHYAYQFDLPNDSKLFLETGAESPATQTFLPQNYIYCGDPRLDMQIADRINGRQEQVYIIRPLNNQNYSVQPVVMASTQQRQGSTYTYRSPFTAFQFDRANAIIGVDLSTGSPGTQVYFEGRDHNPCSGAYLFRQTSPGASTPATSFTFVPELGVTQRSMAAPNRGAETLAAREVDGLPLNRYLATNCDNSMPGNSVVQVQPPGPTVGGAPASYAAAAPATYATTIQPESQAYQSRQGTPPTDKVHTVAKGETLYGIARQYGTTVDALKATNNVNGNTVFVGQKLTISAAPATPQPTVAPTNSGAVVMFNRGNVGSSNPGAPAPTPYGNSGVATPQAYAPPSTYADPQAYAAPLTVPGQTQVYGENTHVVQPGETVASIALRYGYTSAKLREMNQLGASEVVKIGQRLKTSDCNCPPATTPRSPINAPSSYGVSPATPQAFGNPSNMTPRGVDPAFQTPLDREVQSAGTSITNAPAFGTVVPNPSAVPNTTMSRMEGNSPAPSTYRNYPAPAAQFRENTTAQTNYGPAPSTYGGTPVDNNADYGSVNENANRVFHLVQEGESLFNIAQRYGMTVAQLRKLNKLEPADVIVPFQKLYVN